MTDMTYTNIDVPHAPGLLGLISETVATWRARARDRANLALLSGRDIRDMGMSVADVDYEASKPFWVA